MATLVGFLSLFGLCPLDKPPQCHERVDSDVDCAGCQPEGDPALNGGDRSAYGVDWLEHRDQAVAKNARHVVVGSWFPFKTGRRARSDEAIAEDRPPDILLRREEVTDSRRKRSSRRHRRWPFRASDLPCEGLHPHPPVDSELHHTLELERLLSLHIHDGPDSVFPKHPLVRRPPESGRAKWLVEPYSKDFVEAVPNGITSFDAPPLRPRDPADLPIEPAEFDEVLHATSNVRPRGKAVEATSGGFGSLPEPAVQ
jgi:hypothetical protein